MVESANYTNTSLDDLIKADRSDQRKNKQQHVVQKKQQQSKQQFRDAKPHNKRPQSHSKPSGKPHHQDNGSKKMFQGSKGGSQHHQSHSNSHRGANHQNYKVFVGNLSYETQWKSLKDHMRQAGNVLHADVLQNQNGRSKGMGIVEFPSRREAQEAIDLLHESTLDGRTIYVKLDDGGHSGKHQQIQSDHKERNESDSKRRGRSRSRSRSNEFAHRGKNQQHGHHSGNGNGHSSKPHRGENGDSRQSKRRNSSLSPNLSPQNAPLRIQKKTVTRQESPEQENRTIFVGNMPTSVEAGQLTEAFQEFGQILSASVNNDSQGKSRYGLVKFSTRKSALKSIKEMDRAKFNGIEVTVREDKKSKKTTAVANDTLKTSSSGNVIIHD